MRSGETAAVVAQELAEQTKGVLRPGDIPSTVRAMAQLVELLDIQLRNLTPGGKDTAARSLTKVGPPQSPPEPTAASPSDKHNRAPCSPPLRLSRHQNSLMAL